MRAVAGEMPLDDGGWAFEVKWDGMRVLAFVAGDDVRLQTANGIDATVRFPELAGLAGAVGGRSAVLDGEVVAFDPDGRPSFGQLQQRMHLTSVAEVRQRATTVAITYLIFDLLRLDDHDLTGLPYIERRRVLTELVEEGPAWRLPASHTGDGPALLEAAAAQGLEGLVAKRLDSRYEVGRRSPAWRKVKVRRRQELVVGGWLPGQGGREGGLGALLVGYHDLAPPRPLRYAGRVGTGFTERELRRLEGLLAPLARPDSPFTPTPPAPVYRQARWVEPTLVAEVAFGEWTAEGVLRHPSYLGLRADKNPADVVREPA